MYIWHPLSPDTSEALSSSPMQCLPPQGPEVLIENPRNETSLISSSSALIAKLTRIKRIWENQGTKRFAATNENCACDSSRWPVGPRTSDSLQVLHASSLAKVLRTFQHLEMRWRKLTYRMRFLDHRSLCNCAAACPLWPCTSRRNPSSLLRARSRLQLPQHCSTAVQLGTKETTPVIPLLARLTKTKDCDLIHTSHP